MSLHLSLLDLTRLWQLIQKFVCICWSFCFDYDFIGLHFSSLLLDYFCVCIIILSFVKNVVGITELSKIHMYFMRILEIIQLFFVFVFAFFLFDDNSDDIIHEHDMYCIWFLNTIHLIWSNIFVNGLFFWDYLFYILLSIIILFLFYFLHWQFFSFWKFFMIIFY